MYGMKNSTTEQTFKEGYGCADRQDECHLFLLKLHIEANNVPECDGRLKFQKTSSLTLWGSISITLFSYFVGRPFRGSENVIHLFLQYLICYYIRM